MLTKLNPLHYRGTVNGHTYDVYKTSFDGEWFIHRDAQNNTISKRLTIIGWKPMDHDSPHAKFSSIHTAFVYIHQHG